LQGNIREDKVINLQTKYALWLVADEVERASCKHPPLHSAHEGYAVILEELDELKAEVWKKEANMGALIEEAVHVAAMAIRFLTDVCDIEVPDEAAPDARWQQAGMGW
jgi:hypothetical protein